MIFELYFMFLIPLVLSLLVTPFVIRFAKRIGAMDQPDERKVHKHPTPRLGGMAIYVSFCLSLVFYTYYDPSMHPFASMNPHKAVMLVISLTMVLMLGVWDDIRPLTPGRKFLGQCLAAAVVYAAGFQISYITHPFSSHVLNLGIFSFPATLLWIVGITNAFNLIDGLDGLASGVAFIVSLTIATIAFLTNDMGTVMMALLLAGAVLGFLHYNFNGAKIFLGDSGSLFLGFSLAILSMLSSTKGSAAFSILIPILALGLPIMDTTLAMVRRSLRSAFPFEDDAPKSLPRRIITLFLPDRGHIHHQLIARGFSHKKAVLTLYVVSCIFGAGAFAVTAFNNISATPILIIVGIATFIGVSQLRYKEMTLIRTGVLMPISRWPLRASSFILAVIDLGFIIAAYTLAYTLAYRTPLSLDFEAPFVKGLSIIAVIQLVVFILTGLYKRNFQQLGMADLVKILKTTTLAVLITWTVLALLPSPWNTMNAPMIIFDFYFLLSLVMAARISFHVLNYFSRRDQQEGKRRVLIYGADIKGSLMLQRLLNDDTFSYCPVGFLDANPTLAGKHLNGYPIYGDHWKLDRVLKKVQVDEILLSSDQIKPESLRRLKDIARIHGVTVQRVKISFEDVRQEPATTRSTPISITIAADAVHG